ncbi:MAG: NUDIX hydrolase [Acidimicrobiales bacterium]|nr:NUDIX hydrolase [Acidimicrobiales bacterium]
MSSPRSSSPLARLTGLGSPLRRAAYWTFESLPRFLRRRVVGAFMPSYVLAASCVIEGPDGRILVARSAYRRTWVFPGGLLDRNETPDDCVRREVFEEVGLDVKLDSRTITLIDPESRRIDFLYAGRVTDATVTLDPAEMSDYEWVRREDMDDFVERHVTMIDRKLELLDSGVSMAVVSWDDIDGRAARRYRVRSIDPDPAG